MLTHFHSFKTPCSGNDGHVVRPRSWTPSEMLTQFNLELTSWRGHHPSAHQHSPALAPPGHRCRCRNLDKHSSPARPTRTWDTGKRKIRQKSWEIVDTSPVVKDKRVYSVTGAISIQQKEIVASFSFSPNKWIKKLFCPASSIPRLNNNDAFSKYLPRPAQQSWCVWDKKVFSQKTRGCQLFISITAKSTKLTNKCLNINCMTCNNPSNGETICASLLSVPFMNSLMAVITWLVKFVKLMCCPSSDSVVRKAAIWCC